MEVGCPAFVGLVVVGAIVDGLKLVCPAFVGPTDVGATVGGLEVVGSEVDPNHVGLTEVGLTVAGADVVGFAEVVFEVGSSPAILVRLSAGCDEVGLEDTASEAIGVTVVG